MSVKETEDLSELFSHATIKLNLVLIQLLIFVLMLLCRLTQIFCFVFFPTRIKLNHTTKVSLREQNTDLHVL